MKGLLLKDFLNLSKTKGMYLLITAVLAGYCLYKNLYSFIVIVPILILSTAVTSTFSMDRSIRWDRITASSSLEKKELVISKFLVLFLTTLIGTLFGILISLPLFFTHRLTLPTLAQMTLFALEIALVSGNICLLLIYLFQKNSTGRIELFTLFGYLAGAVLVSVLWRLLKNLSLDIFGIFAVSLCIVLALEFLFCHLCIKAYKNQEIL